MLYIPVQYLLDEYNEIAYYDHHVYILIEITF
jgi:hypothetical protein